MGLPKLMENMTVNEMREGLKKTKTVIVPIGGTEQHGYHLPLSTDSIGAYEVAKRVSQKTGCFVAPILNYSFSGGELPGTTDISPQTVGLILMDICNSLANQGFKNIIILSGHGGSENLRAVKESAIIFYRRYHWWRGKINIAPILICDLSKGWLKAFKKKDYHAGYIETSIILYLRPDFVRKKIVRDKLPIANMLRNNPDSYQVFKKLVEDKFVSVQTSQDPRIKVGVMGDVSKINVKIGKKVVDECVTSLNRLVKKMGCRGG